ncbi:MAG TPA: DinB family protein [Thermoanaerobaculia bacterium]|nr:DinB family protein [Thermoanaerobaculia bacterium]
MTSFDFLLETYDTERLKTVSVWSSFEDGDFEFRPVPRIRTPHEHMVHQCVSEDNWMKGMLGIDTGKPAIPTPETRLDFLRHYAALSGERLAMLREKPEAWWNEASKFFDADRTRSWIMLRRLTHSAHHRAQLTVYLRLLGRLIYSTYGPSADTGGLPVNQAPTMYRYRDIDELLRAEASGGDHRHLPGPGQRSPTERPNATPVRRSLERVGVRMRDSNVTQPAWRVTADSIAGNGSITLLDSGFYRGDGIFYGWTQEQLIAEYSRLNPPANEPVFEPLQLG